MPENQKRGRPRQFNEATAVNSAMELFWSVGFAGASTSQLEKKTGLARSSMLNTFGSKRQLLNRSLDAYLASMERDLTGPLRDGTDGLDDLIHFFNRLAILKSKTPGNKGCLMVNTSIELPGDSDIRVRSQAYRNLLNEAFNAALDRATRAGEIPKESVTHRMSLLTALAVSINLAARSLGPEAASGICSAAQAEIRLWRNSPR